MLAVTSNLPALADHRYLRFSAFAILYAAQGLPSALFSVAIPGWLAARGASIGEVGGYMAIAFLPWSFKLVAGPIMDRFTFLPMGRRRPWVIGAQLGLTFAMILLAFVPDPENNLALLAAAGFVANGFAALQDVAVDGMAIDVLPHDERSRANAFMFGGQALGAAATASGGTYLLVNYGLASAGFMMCGAVLLIMLVPLLFRERREERLLPWTPGRPSAHAEALQVHEWRPIFSDLGRSLILPMSILLVTVEFLQRASSGILGAVLPILTVGELGWTEQSWGDWVAISAIASAIFGVMIAPFVDIYGARGALALAILGKALVIGSVPMLQHLWADEAFLQSVIVANAMLSQVVTVSIIAIFMNICSPRVAASQFAIYMASANLALAAGNAMAAGMDPYLDAPGMLYVAAGFNVAFLLLWPFFNMESHRQRMAIKGLAEI